jgi:hypothetical protein
MTEGAQQALRRKVKFYNILEYLLTCFRSNDRHNGVV